MTDRTTDPRDEKLIVLCIRLAGIIAQVRAAYAVDPCGNSTHAENVDDKGLIELLNKISSTPAKSWSGVEAKVRLVSFLIDPADFEFEVGYGDNMQFMLLLANDVKRLLKEDRLAEFSAELAEKGGAQ